MGLFPTHPQNNADDGTLRGLEGKFPPGTPERAATERLIEILKKAHVIFRGLLKEDKELRVKGEQGLQQMLRDMGVSNEVDIMALMSIIASFAAITPPSAYGEDHNDW